MKKVVVTRLVPHKKSVVWNYLADLKSYPNHVTFVKKVEFAEKPKKGSEWYDTTVILWIPVKLYHLNIHWEEKSGIAFSVRLPLGGTMIQEYLLTSQQDKTQITAVVSFDFNNKILDIVLGRLLSKRLKYMLLSTFERLDKKLQTI